MKYCKYISTALVVSGMILGVLFANPACYAGGAAIIVPTEDRDVPDGSLIPDRRTKKIEMKVREYKKMKKARNAEQQQEQLTENELPKPEAPDKQ